MDPFDVFELNIKRVEALIGTHKLLHNKKGKPKTVVSDVLRAGVVMTVSAFDAYLHGILKVNVGAAASLAPPPDALLALIKEWKLDAKTILPFMLNAKGPEDLTALVESHFEDRTLQDPSKVAHVFEILGISSVWTDVAQRLGRQEADVRKDFAGIVKRRHRIAHEADIDPDGKGSTKKRPMRKDTAESYKDSVVAVTAALNAIVKTKFP